MPRHIDRGNDSERRLLVMSRMTIPEWTSSRHRNRDEQAITALASKMKPVQRTTQNRLCTCGGWGNCDHTCKPGYYETLQRAAAWELIRRIKSQPFFGAPQS